MLRNKSKEQSEEKRLYTDEWAKERKRGGNFIFNLFIFRLRKGHILPVAL
jgi:hypothetical protein